MPGAFARRGARTKGPVGRMGEAGRVARGRAAEGKGRGTEGAERGGAESRGLLTQSGKWAAAAERGGPMAAGRARSGSRGRRDRGGKRLGGLLSIASESRRGFAHFRSLLRTDAPVPREDGWGRALGGRGQWLQVGLAFRKARRRGRGSR